jgi:hypothetical protein
LQACSTLRIDGPLGCWAQMLAALPGP